MPSPSDPTRRWRVALRALALAGVLLCALSAWWASAPLDRRAGQGALDTSAVGAAEALHQRRPIDPADFDVILWPVDAVAERPAPEPSIPASAPSPAPAPLPRLTLVAIVSGEARDDVPRRRAAVHDVDSDRLLMLEPGDGVRGWTLRAIAERDVELADGSGRALRLSLREGGTSR